MNLLNYILKRQAIEKTANLVTIELVNNTCVRTIISSGGILPAGKLTLDANGMPKVDNSNARLKIQSLGFGNIAKFFDYLDEQVGLQKMINDNVVDLVAVTSEDLHKEAEALKQQQEALLNQVTPINSVTKEKTFIPGVDKTVANNTKLMNTGFTENFGAPEIVGLTGVPSAPVTALPSTPMTTGNDNALPADLNPSAPEVKVEEPAPAAKQETLIPDEMNPSKDTKKGKK